MSGHLQRDAAACKCKYCQTYEHVHQQRGNHHQRSHKYQHQHQAYEHLSGGGTAAPPGATVTACGHARGKSPPRFQKVEQPPTCCGNPQANKCSAFEDPQDCRKNRFQELRKTWSEFARVCNCPNCKGSLQKERYLDKLAESADRVSAFKQQQRMNCEEQCCCSESSLASGSPYEQKSPHPASRANNYDYEQQQQQRLRQQRDEYIAQYQLQQNRRIQQQIPPYPCQEASSDERLLDCPGSVGCKCLTCSCNDSQKMKAQKIIRQPRSGGVKKERVKHHYY